MFLNLTAPDQLHQQFLSMALEGRFAGTIQYHEEQLKTLMKVNGTSSDCFFIVVCRDGEIRFRGKLMRFVSVGNGRAEVVIDEILCC